MGGKLGQGLGAFKKGAGTPLQTMILIYIERERETDG